MAQTSERVYEDFEPVSDLLSEEQCDTLLLYLPGFRKEQMKVHLSALGKLRVFGERPMGGNKWRRFQKEFNVPPNIDFKEMTAKFEGGILYIRQPKLIAPDEQEHEEKAAAEAPAPELQQQPSSEEKTEKKDEGEEDATEKREQDEISEEKNDERTEKPELNKILAAQAGGSSGLFKELRKPEILGKLVVYVILLLILASNIIKTLKLSSNFEQQSVLEYDHKEL